LRIGQTPPLRPWPIVGTYRLSDQSSAGGPHEFHQFKPDPWLRYRTGTPRYSRHNRQREERADHLARECNGGFLPVTIGNQIEVGFQTAEVEAKVQAKVQRGMWSGGG
jgi:hypothetical protein